MATEFLREIDEDTLTRIIEDEPHLVEAGYNVEQEIGRELSTDEFWIFEDIHAELWAGLTPNRT